MGKKFTISIVVEDDNNEYNGDVHTLCYYVNSVIDAPMSALNVKVVSVDVKGKR